MRRRFNKKTKPKEFVNETIRKKVTDMMLNRRKILAPFPIVAEEIYRLLWTDDEWKAIVLLHSRRPEMLGDISEMALSYPDGERERHVKVRLRPDRPGNPQYARRPLSDLPGRMQESIREWMPLWTQYTEEQLQLDAKLKSVSDVCNTWGQIFRVWPDLQGFFEEEARLKVDRAAVQSKYPESACRWEWNEAAQKNINQGLKDDFAPAAFVPFSNMIAECLMLPMMPDHEVATLTNY